MSRSSGFLPRAEPHINFSYILKNGCNGNWRFRDNQYEVFVALDEVIANLIDARNSTNLTWLSQNQVFKFDLSNDFMNCEELYWSDGDHFSIAGEIRFGKRLPENFLAINKNE